MNLWALRLDTALPADVRVPVDCSHGFQLWINVACRALRSSVHPFAMVSKPLVRFWGFAARYALHPYFDALRSFFPTFRIMLVGAATRAAILWQVAQRVVDTEGRGEIITSAAEDG